MLLEERPVDVAPSGVGGSQADVRADGDNGTDGDDQVVEGHGWLLLSYWTVDSRVIGLCVCTD